MELLAAEQSNEEPDNGATSGSEDKYTLQKSRTSPAQTSQKGN
jgi:hypothetical protein